MGHDRTELSYLKSVLLWLQEYWTGPNEKLSLPRAASNEWDFRSLVECWVD
jgi:hypothetical protein